MEDNKTIVVKRKDTTRDDFYRAKIQKRAEEYESINNARIANDFMYMMLSNANIKDKRHFLSHLVDTIEESYGPKTYKNGVDEQEIKFLRWMVSQNNPLYHDALWFFAMYVVQPLRYWLLMGNPESPDPKEKEPPHIGDKRCFDFFIKSYGFGHCCETLLNGGFNSDSSLEHFVLMIRSEYGMTVGIYQPQDK